MNERVHAGASDCEQVRGRFLGQRANALSSLAYLVVGIWLARRGRHRGDASHRAHAVYGLAVASNGIGSVAFHGPGGRVSKQLHDGALACTGVAAVVPVVLAIGRRPRIAPLLFGTATFGAAAVIYARSRTGGPWCCPECAIQGHAVWHVLTAVSLGAVGMSLLDAR